MAEFDAQGVGKYATSEYWSLGASNFDTEEDFDVFMTIMLDYTMNEDDPIWMSELKTVYSPELAAEVFLDGLGLGWRLDDDERLLRSRPFLCRLCRLFRRLFCRLLDGGGFFFRFFYLFCCSRQVITPFSRACIRAYHFPRRGL